MADVVNIYCDESTHLLGDGQPNLVLGALWMPALKAREVSARISEIKAAAGFHPRTEAKWGKVSNSLRARGMYSALIDYFFDDDDLHFRAVVAPKAGLDHGRFGQTHDDWYYKMYYQLLVRLIDPRRRHRVFLDYKDTRGAEKVARLHEYLCNKQFDFNRSIVERLELVRSHDVAQIQLVDLLAGAINYASRGLAESATKRALVERIRARSKYSLLRSTLVQEQKLNLFFWHPQEAAGNQQ